MNAEKAKAVCELVAEGKSLRESCASLGFSHSTFLDWCKESQELADQYAHARDIGSDAEFERLQELVDLQPERGPAGGVDAGWVAWKRLQVDTKKWALSKKAPRKYGDKVAHEHTGSFNVTLSSSENKL